MRNRGINFRNIVGNYLTDDEKGMQQHIKWFLNAVMNEEVAQEARKRSSNVDTFAPVACFSPPRISSFEYRFQLV